MLAAVPSVADGDGRLRLRPPHRVPQLHARPGDRRAARTTVTGPDVRRVLAAGQPRTRPGDPATWLVWPLRPRCRVPPVVQATRPELATRAVGPLLGPVHLHLHHHRMRPACRALRAARRVRDRLDRPRRADRRPGQATLTQNPRAYRGRARALRPAHHPGSRRQHLRTPTRGADLASRRTDRDTDHDRHPRTRHHAQPGATVRSGRRHPQRHRSPGHRSVPHPHHHRERGTAGPAGRPGRQTRRDHHGPAAHTDRTARGRARRALLPHRPRPPRTPSGDAHPVHSGHRRTRLRRRTPRRRLHRPRRHRTAGHRLRQRQPPHARTAQHRTRQPRPDVHTHHRTRAHPHHRRTPVPRGLAHRATRGRRLHLPDAHRRRDPGRHGLHPRLRDHRHQTRTSAATRQRRHTTRR